MQLDYEGREQGNSVEFLPPERRQQTLVLQNVSQSSIAMLFKVQCTDPRKLRVRPAMGLLSNSGDVVSIHIQLSPQECGPAAYKLLVVGRLQALVADGELKTLWRAAEADPESLVLSETVDVQVRNVSDVAVATNDKFVVDHVQDEAQTATPQLTTTQIAEVVLLLMKNQSHRKENALTTDEQERLQAARDLYASDWPCWEEYAARMRKLLRERNKRKTPTT